MEEEAPGDLSIEDTLSETLKGIKARDDSPADAAAETANAPAPAPEKPVEARSRDESGRFAPKVETPEPVTPVEPPKPAYVPKWQKQALEKWTALDPVVKAEIEKREQDFHKGIEGYKTDAQYAREVKEALSPYLATIQSMGAQPHQAVQALFATEHALRYGTPQQKWQMLQRIANEYGIAPSQQSAPQQTAQAAPEVQMLYQRLAQLENHLNDTYTNQQQAQISDLNTQIQKFSTDPARAEYFETLRPQMASLLKSGLADSLESAFEQAFQTHPVTKSIWIAKQQEDWRKQAAQKAEVAKKTAAVNVSQRGTLPTGAVLGDMTDTIRAKARELGLVS